MAPPDIVVIVNLLGALAGLGAALNARAGAALEDAKSCPAPQMTEESTEEPPA